MDNIDYLPVWKKDATPEERFLELAMIARKYPDRFRAFVVIYQESLRPDDCGARFEIGCNTYGVDTRGALGLIEIGKFDLLQAMLP